jgi:hypothetical protein
MATGVSRSTPQQFKWIDPTKVPLYVDGLVRTSHSLHVGTGATRTWRLSLTCLRFFAKHVTCSYHKTGNVSTHYGHGVIKHETGPELYLHGWYLRAGSGVPFISDPEATVLKVFTGQNSTPCMKSTNNGYLFGGSASYGNNYSTVSAIAIYDNNTILTDYVFEAYFTGHAKDPAFVNYKVPPLDDAKPPTVFI